MNASLEARGRIGTKGIRIWLRSAALVIATLLCGTGISAASAQDTSPPPPVEQAPRVAQQQQPRSLFLAALAPVLGAAVQHVSGSLFDAMFPPASPSFRVPATYAGAPPASLAAGDGQIYAGLAYEAYRVGPNGLTERVDPSNYVFRTGDMFFIRYMPNLPGRMEAWNVNSYGRQTLLGAWEVAAGQLLTLPAQGAFQFAGPTGNEILRLVLTPCSNGFSRDIIVNPNAQRVDYGSVLPACGGGPVSVARDIVINVDGQTGYGVSNLDQTELSSGKVDARAITIAFRHQ